MATELQVKGGRVDDPTVIRRVSALMVFEAATLAVASAVHLLGHVQGRSRSYSATGAAVAEVVIGAVLLCAAIAMYRTPAGHLARARTIGLAATGFAIAGFLFGLSITATSGHMPDIAYHVTMLPILIAGEVVLARHRMASLD